MPHFTRETGKRDQLGLGLRMATTAGGAVETEVGQALMAHPTEADLHTQTLVVADAQFFEGFVNNPLPAVPSPDADLPSGQDSAAQVDTWGRGLRALLQNAHALATLRIPLTCSAAQAGRVVTATSGQFVIGHSAEIKTAGTNQLVAVDRTFGTYLLP